MFTKFKKVSLLIGFLLIIANTAIAAPFWPLQVGTQSKFSGTDSLGNSWVSTFDIVGTATYNSKEYFHVQVYNYENGGETEDIYIRVTDTQGFSYRPDLGAEVLTAQTGAVGTQWNWPLGGGDYMYFEITSIGSVSVPYGTFATTYGITHCKGSSGAGGTISNCTTPTDTDYFAPGVGNIKEVDYWAVANPPKTQVLTSVSRHLLYATYGGQLWQWDGIGWSMINTAVPASMVASGRNLYATYGGQVWQWDGTAWTRINTAIPTSMVASSSLLYANYGGTLWQWDGSAWTPINTAIPANMVVSGSMLYADYGADGLWQWHGSAWTPINTASPTSMVAGFLNPFFNP